MLRISENKFLVKNLVSIGESDVINEASKSDDSNKEKNICKKKNLKLAKFKNWI